ncbi:MAG: hypothetical protein NE330_02770 [Lentisphaeraceae bacterium]|nr:hypothetical protein [Lentisphaeraceae bacterium]
MKQANEVVTFSEPQPDLNGAMTKQAQEVKDSGGESYAERFLRVSYEMIGNQELDDKLRIDVLRIADTALARTESTMVVPVAIPMEPVPQKPSFDLDLM